MAWERLALVYAILVPPLCLLVLVGLMATEAQTIPTDCDDYFFPECCNANLNRSDLAHDAP